MAFQRQKTTTLKKKTKTQHKQLCVLCSCFMPVTASLCRKGCKRVKKCFVFSVTEMRPCYYPVSERNAGKSLAIWISPLQGCNRIIFAFQQLPSIYQQSCMISSSTCLQNCEAFIEVYKYYCILKVYQRCPECHIAFKLLIDVWLNQLFEKIVLQLQK